MGTHSKRARRVARHRPAPSTVEGSTLLHEDTDNAAATERLRVHLPLDLERVKRKEHDLANTRETDPTRLARCTGRWKCARYTPSRRCLHDHLALALAERVGERGLIVLVEEVIEVRLAAELVYPLRDLVAGSITKTRKEGEEAAPERCVCVLAEEDGRKVCQRDLGCRVSLVTLQEPHKIRTLFLLLMSRFAMVSTGWKTSSSAIPACNSSEVNDMSFVQLRP